MAPRTLSWIVLFVVLLALGFRLHSLARRSDVEKLARQQAAYQTARGLLLERYIRNLDDNDEKKLFFGAMDGLTGSLDDPNTQFLTPEAYEWLKTSTEGHFSGIGVEIDLEDKKLTVITPLLDSPAYKGGLLPGDRILKIDDTPTDKMPLEEAKRRLRGPEGTRVTVTLLHEGEMRPVAVALVRADVEIKSVPAAEVLGPPWVPDGGPKLGYVQVVQFQQNTEEDLDAALKALESQGIQGAILDLRQNPGGLLEEATDVADLFLKDGVIVSVVTRVAGSDQTKEEMKYATGAAHPDYPLVILVDARSASAAEVVSGALQDRGRAVLVGDKTYGKFSVQEVHRVGLGEWGDAALKLTVAKYKTPKGPCVDGQGIVPDYLVASNAEQQKGLLISRYWKHLQANDPRAAPLDARPRGKVQAEAERFVDTQLQKAVEVLLARVGAVRTLKP